MATHRDKCPLQELHKVHVHDISTASAEDLLVLSSVPAGSILVKRRKGITLSCDIAATKHFTHRGQQI